MTDFTDLEISPTQCQELLAIDTLIPLVLDGLRVVYLRQPQAIGPFLLTEGFIFLGILIVVLPLVLVVSSNVLTLDGTTTSAMLLQLTLGIALVVWVGVNGLLGWRAWRWRAIALLYQRIEQYNHLVKTLAWAAQLSTPTPNPEMYETLAALRTSLLGRIQLEQLHSRHPGHPLHHQTLIAQLDQQLDTLLHTDTEDPNAEAARLLHDAVALGIQVHREMRRL